jgi:hypothetical protein
MPLCVDLPRRIVLSAEIYGRDARRVAEGIARSCPELTNPILEARLRSNGRVRSDGGGYKVVK